MKRVFLSLWWHIGWGLCSIYFWIFHGVRSKGLSNIPDRGPAIVAANHQSFLDPPLICVPGRTPLRFMAQAYLFRIPLLGPAIRGFGAFPVDRDQSLKETYGRSLKVLKSGELLGMHPEGGRGDVPDGVIRFQDGVARLALRTGATIVPATITGGYRVWRKGRRFPIPGRLAVTYHPAFSPGKGRRRDEIARIQARLEEVIAPRLGPAFRAFRRIDRLQTGPSSPLRLQELLPFALGILLLASWRTTPGSLILPGLAAYAAYLLADLFLLRPRRAWKYLRDASPLLLIAGLHPAVGGALPAISGGLLPLLAFVLPGGIQATWSGQPAGCRWVLGTTLVYLGVTASVLLGWGGAWPGWLGIAISYTVFHLAHSLTERRLQARRPTVMGPLLAGLALALLGLGWGMGDLGIPAGIGVAAYILSRLLPSRSRSR